MSIPISRPGKNAISAAAKKIMLTILTVFFASESALMRSAISGKEIKSAKNMHPNAILFLPGFFFSSFFMSLSKSGSFSFFISRFSFFTVLPRHDEIMSSAVRTPGMIPRAIRFAAVV